MPNTWHSSGAYLLNRLPGRGGLEVTPDYLRAFLARPELAPVDESCDAERALHAALLEDPLKQVDETHFPPLPMKMPGTTIASSCRSAICWRPPVRWRRPT
jgi:hypothetical protein